MFYFLVTHVFDLCCMRLETGLKLTVRNLAEQTGNKLLLYYC